MNPKYKYDIAISFAEEDRNAALALTLALEMVGQKRVYYYPDRRGDTWGEEMKGKLTKIYSEEAQYAVVLVSKKYFEKTFAKIELKAIRIRMQNSHRQAYMLPIILETNLNLKEHADLIELGRIKWEYDPESIAATLCERLGQKNVDGGKQEVIVKKKIEKKQVTNLFSYTYTNTVNNISQRDVISTINF